MNKHVVRGFCAVGTVLITLILWALKIVARNFGIDAESDDDTVVRIYVLTYPTGIIIGVFLHNKEIRWVMNLALWTMFWTSALYFSNDTFYWICALLHSAYFLICLTPDDVAAAFDKISHSCRFEKQDSDYARA